MSDRGRLSARGILELTKDHVDTVKERERALARRATRRLQAIAAAIPDLSKALPTAVRSSARVDPVDCDTGYLDVFEFTGSSSLQPRVTIEYQSTGPSLDAVHIAAEEFQAAGFVLVRANQSNLIEYELKRAMKSWGAWVSLMPSGPETFMVTGSVAPTDSRDRCRSIAD